MRYFPATFRLLRETEIDEEITEMYNVTRIAFIGRIYNIIDGNNCQANYRTSAWTVQLQRE